jgi:hypothetical protein
MSVSYKEIKDVLKMLGINPYELYVLDRKNFVGWFPDLPDRKPTVDVNKLANILLGKEGNVHDDSQNQGRQAVGDSSGYHS